MERRIVRRLRGWRGFRVAGPLGTFLLLGSPSLGQDAPNAPAAPAPDAPRSVSYVLDRIQDAQASSIVLDSVPPPPVTIDLDAIEPEFTSPDGTERTWKLAIPIARGATGAARPPRLKLGGGEPPPEMKLELIAARREVMLKDEPAFRDCPRASDAHGNRYVLISDVGGTSFDWELPPFPCRFGLSARILGAKDDAIGGDSSDPFSPTVTLLADEQKLGAFELMAALPDELRFYDLPLAESAKITFDVSHVAPDEGKDRIAALRSFVIEARDGHDRVRVTAPKGTRGLSVQYESTPPPPVQLIYSSTSRRAPPQEQEVTVMLAPGRAGVVVAEPQRGFEVLIDGKSVGTAGERSYELVFESDALGPRQLTLRSTTGLVGEWWLLQPRGFYQPLHDPLASLSESTPFVRGLESPPGHPLVRHMMLMGETRRALLAPVGTDVTIPVTIAAGDVLNFSVGSAWLCDVVLPRGNFGYEVELITPDGEVHPLAGEKKLPKRRRMGWQPKSASPPAGYAGPAKLRFRTFATERSPFAASDGVLAFAEPTLVHASGPKRTNLLIYLIDTLRADHCTPWGYARPTTPRLSELAGEGILFENAFSQAPWTRPSVGTLFTGWLHSFHGASKMTGLSPQIVTLAETMRDAGYATAGFIANAHVHGSSLNFEQGFSQFNAIEKTKQRTDSRAGDVNEACFEWLDAHRGEPFFLYLHTIDPHAPYDPPETTLGTWGKGYDGWVEPQKTGARQLTRKATAKEDPLDADDLQHVVDLYDEEILHNDREFAALCARLKELGLWDDTIVVVVSDHGEEFWEHEGFGHGTWLWQELLHVPLIVKPDRREGDQLGRRVADRVRIMDVMPTLLDRMGIRDSAAKAMGTSLGTFFTGGELADELPIIAEEYPDKVTLITGKWKWIHFGPKSRKNRQPETWLFDLEADADEQDDLSDRMPEVAEQMRKAMARLVSDFEKRGFIHMKGVQEHLSADDIAKLAKLGYGAGAEDAGTDLPVDDVEHGDDPPADDEMRVEDPEPRSGGK